MQADELTAALKAADAAVAAEERKATAVRGDVEAERGRLEAELAGLTTTRAAIEQKMSPEYVRLFNDGVATRRGVAVSAIRDGHCQACQVTVRPQQIMQARQGRRDRAVRIVQAHSLRAAAGAGRGRAWLAGGGGWRRRPRVIAVTIGPGPRPSVT